MANKEQPHTDEQRRWEESSRRYGDEWRDDGKDDERMDKQQRDVAGTIISAEPAKRPGINNSIGTDHNIT